MSPPQTMLPSAPPPPPPPIPWFGRSRPQNQDIPNNAPWPHRLLFVPSTTSYVRKNFDTYDRTRAPRYNVLSYTWGNFQSPTATAISIHGVDWPIPAIKESHFTADDFRNAIERAANGVKHRCEWLWVDIACIPQEHEKETKEAMDIRGQEIGRQVEIFRRAQETFAWLSHLKSSELCDNQPPTTIEDVLFHANKGGSVQTAEAAAAYLEVCDDVTRRMVAWMNKVLSHPLFQSLWSLQEMVLRRDAWILFDDGFLFLYGETTLEQGGFQVNFAEKEIMALRAILIGIVTGFLDKSQALLQSSRNDNMTVSRGDEIRERLQNLLSAYLDRGLDALTITMPHFAYSAAQHRNSGKLTDRIYGIVQTYGITCDPNPAGEDDLAKLRALEDEFGAKLVAKSGLLSQIFIHSADEPPRRSWLITQRCTVDYCWQSFSPLDTRNDVHELCTLIVLKDTGNIAFHGKAWRLDAFVKSEPKHIDLFRFWVESPFQYLGLMLDQHVSRQVLDGKVDYFNSREAMLEAVQNLKDFYGESPIVAVLGSGSSYDLPVVRYVGLVLVRAPDTHDESTWARIGLYRWLEVYHTEEPSIHYYLPPSHEFRCVIR